MRSKLRGGLALAATLVMAGVVRADAPPGQYETFGRSDTCITDAFTMLTWLRTPSAAASLGDAVAQCHSLATDGTDWRVPTLNELETLVDEVPHYELEGDVYLPKAIDANAFPGTPVLNSYWTSSLGAGTATKAWAVDFQDGSTSLIDVTEQSLEVRCVAWSPTKTPSACE
jgi:hypothetical protein